MYRIISKVYEYEEEEAMALYTRLNRKYIWIRRGSMDIKAVGAEGGLMESREKGTIFGGGFLLEKD